MNQQYFKKVFDVFDIKLINTKNTRVYDKIDIGVFYNEEIINKEIAFNTKIKYNIEVDEQFLYMLLDVIKYIEYQHDMGENIPNAGVMYEYLKDFFEEKYHDRKLENKYTQLKEIKKEYEVMKKLIVDSDDL